MKTSPRFMHCHVFVPADLTRGVLLIYKCQIAGRRSHKIRIKLKQNRTCFKQNHRRVKNPNNLFVVFFTQNFLGNYYTCTVILVKYCSNLLFQFIMIVVMNKITAFALF